MRTIYLLLIIPLISGCRPDVPETDCLVANYITHGCCSGTTIFEIASSSAAIGAPLTLYTAQGELKLKNAIQIAGKFEESKFVKLRAFDWEKDEGKKVIECLCFMSEPWADLPMYVITQDCTSGNR